MFDFQIFCPLKKRMEKCDVDEIIRPENAVNKFQCHICSNSYVYRAHLRRHQILYEHIDSNYIPAKVPQKVCSTFVKHKHSFRNLHVTCAAVHLFTEQSYCAICYYKSMVLQQIRKIKVKSNFERSKLTY